MTGPESQFPAIEREYGRPIADWMRIVRDSPWTRHMELVAVLRDDHGIDEGHAIAIVVHTLYEDTGH